MDRPNSARTGGTDRPRRGTRRPDHGEATGEPDPVPRARREDDAPPARGSRHRSRGDVDSPTGQEEAPALGPARRLGPLPLPRTELPSDTPVGERVRVRGSLLGSAAVLATGQAGAQIASALLLVIAARVGEPHSFGLVAIWYAAVTGAVVALDFGVSTRLVRDGGDDDVLRSLYGAKSAALGGLAVVSCVIAFAVPGAGWLVLAGWCYTGLRVAALVVQSRWQASGRFAVSAAMVFGERLVALAVGWLLALAHVPVLVLVPVAMVVGVLATGVVPLTAAVRELAGPGWARLRPGLAFGRHFAGASIAGNLAMLDTVVVGAVAGAEQAGYFAAGSRLLGPLLVLIGAAATVVLGSRHRRGESTRLVRVVLVLSGVLLALLWFAAPELVPMVLGPEYLAAVAPVRVYCLAFAFVAVAHLQATALQAAGREVFVSRVLPVGVFSGLAATAVGALVAPTAGLSAATGGAIGYCAASAAVCAVLRLARR
ncbi:lipopolysaccharide biosynthesis protein [Actinosynnema sp. NPDC020468]|uniref:lipopolysaccharide biosynthesis protein n=1 Tax=Actinosynnema sp. NPDC020468 TaxID=3154488 RepID=UPI0033F4235F